MKYTKTNEEMIKTEVTLAKAGEGQSIYRLWEYMNPLRRKWASSCNFLSWDIDDLDQQSYLILLEALEKYDQDKGMDFPGYYKMRLYIWRSRKSRKQREYLSIGEDITTKLTESADITQDVERDTLLTLEIEQLMKEMDSLSYRERKSLLGYYLENKSTLDLAKELGTTIKAVQKSRERALKKLRQQRNLGSEATL